jgi:hypothetical protein
LERLSIGPFALTDAIVPEEFDPERDLRALAPEEAARLGLGVLRLGESDGERFRNGGVLGNMSFEEWPGAGRNPQEGPQAVFDAAGSILGVVESVNGILSYRLVLGGER